MAHFDGSEIMIQAAAYNVDFPSSADPTNTNLHNIPGEKDGKPC